MQLFSNNAKSTLAAGINDTDVALSVTTGEGALFAAPTGGDYQMITLTNAAKTAYETVKCTARSADTLTILRAQEGTTAQSWSAGATVFAGATKDSLENMVQTDDTRLSGIGDMLLTLRTPPSDYLAADGSSQSAAVYPDLAALLTVTPAAWTIRTSAADKLWNDICWSPELSLFCACVGDQGSTTSIMTSPDGVTWTARTTPSDIQLTSVCWSPALTLFVAVASFNTTTLTDSVLTSPDGITWTTRSAIYRNWRCVIWAPELALFVAVSNAGITTDSIMTSPDGITWTGRVNPSSESRYESVCWSPELSLLVAVSGGGYAAAVVTSPDGITWTARTDAGTDHEWDDVCWSPELGLFCAVADYSVTTLQKVMTSPDGITWTLRNSATDNAWRSVCWSPLLSKFFAVSDSGTGTRVMSSADGITWATETSAADNSWQAIAWAPEIYTLAAVSSSGVGNRVMTKGVDTFATPDWSGVSATGTAYVKAL